MAFELRTFADIYTAVIHELKEQTNDTNVVERVKRLVNMVYLDEVVPFDNWEWLRKFSNVSRPATVTGTASLTEGSNAVTLSATVAYTLKGYKFSIEGHNVVYEVFSHTAGTAAVRLDVPFEGDTNATASYQTWRDVVPLPVECANIVSVSSARRPNGLEGVGLSKFRALQALNPKAEDSPAYYSLTQPMDPVPYDTISSLPAVSTRASAGYIRTVVFASTVADYLSPGDRVEFAGSSSESFIGQFTVRTVSTTTVTFTGASSATVASAADAGLAITKLTQKLASESYRSLRVYPAIYDEVVTLGVDWVAEAEPLVNDADEPLIPLKDRIVLYYGTLRLAWGSIARNPEQLVRNENLFNNKLGLMAGRLNESTDFPKLQPDKTYLHFKRNRRSRTKIE